MVNPSIRKVLELSECHRKGEIVKANVALGYDTSTGQFKIVWAFKPKYGRPVRCMVFTLGCRSWRFVGDLPFPICTFFMPVAVNEAIIWKIRPVFRPRGPEIAFSFDIKNETFNTIVHSKDYSRYSSLMELGGYLCILDLPESVSNWQKKELWILKDYSNRSWIKLTLNLERVENPTWVLATALSPLAIQGGNFLMTDREDRFDCYDLETGCFDKPLFLNNGYATPYVESLISPLKIHETAMGWRLPANRCMPWWQEGRSNEHTTASSLSCSSRGDRSWWQWEKNLNENADSPADMDEAVWPKSIPNGLIVYY